MSTLDQAFIRAYQDRVGSRVGAPTQPVSLQTAEVQHAKPLQQTLPQAAPSPRSSQFSSSQPTSSQASPFPATLPLSASVTESPAPPLPTSAGGERKPLSAFTPAPTTVEAKFQPGLEVDAFAWSDVCNELTAAGAPYWKQLNEALEKATDEGRTVVGIAGTTEGVGCTTLLLCVARSLAASGKSIAIVDGNFSAPGLAHHLGLEVDLGWEQVLSGDSSLSDAVVGSLHDSIALLPLVRGGLRAAEQLDSIHSSVTAGVLRYHYDLVLMDLGSLANTQQANFAETISRQCRLDAALLVTNNAEATIANAGHYDRLTPSFAAVTLGTLENEPARIHLAAAG